VRVLRSLRLKGAADGSPLADVARAAAHDIPAGSECARRWADVFPDSSVVANIWGIPLMADVLKIALFGAAGWVGYQYILKPWMAAPATAAGTPAATPPATGGTVPVVKTPSNSLDAAYALMVSKANAPSLNVDQWDWFLMDSIPNFTAPDPMPRFSAAIPNFDRTAPMSASDYWNVMAPWLKANAGLSGLGPRGLGWMYRGRG